MFKLVKKSMIIGILLGSIPVVHAQDVITGAFNEVLQLLFSLIGEIMRSVLGALSQDPIYGKAFIAAFMGIFFYSELKVMDVFKKNVKLAGFIAVLIALIVAYWLPWEVSALFFSQSTPFIGFVIPSFILLIAQTDSNWSRAARAISFLTLSIAFGSIVNLFPDWAQIIIAGFIIASLVAFIYNLVKLRSGTSKEEIDIEDNLEKYEKEEKKPKDEGETGNDILDWIRKRIKGKRRKDEPSPKGKVSYEKPELKKLEEFNLRGFLEELNSETVIASSLNNKTSDAITKMSRSYDSIKGRLNELTKEVDASRIREGISDVLASVNMYGMLMSEYFNPLAENRLMRRESERSLWGDISNTYKAIVGREPDSPILIPRTPSKRTDDDRKRDSINVEEWDKVIAKNISKLDKGVKYYSNKNLFEMDKKLIIDYKTRVLQNIENIKKLNDWYKGLANSINKSIGNINRGYDGTEAEKREFIEKVNKILEYIDRQFEALSQKKKLYRKISDLSSSISVAIVKDINRRE